MRRRLRTVKNGTPYEDYRLRSPGHKSLWFQKPLLVLDVLAKGSQLRFGYWTLAAAIKNFYNV